MLVLCDTGILLRLLDPAAPQHQAVVQAVATIQARGDDPVTSPQNVAEFWNVSTRPATARGRYGLSVQDTDNRLQRIEQLIRVLPYNSAAYAIWKHLVLSLGVMGVQAHDARLVAWMMAQSITHILTLNPAEFTRYSGITTVHP